MLASLRPLMLLAGASSLAIAAAPQDQLAPFGDQLRRMPADPQAPALAAAITEWKALQQSATYGFDVYARFLLAHPGWPGEASRRRAAERALDTASWSPGVAVSFFRRFPPLTPTGMVRFAEALKATGMTSEANDAARAAWVRGALPPADEAALLSGFAGVLTTADHDARMDALLWAGSTGSAQRQIALVSPARRELFDLRLALRTRAPDAGDRAALVADRFANEPGFLADYALWLKNANRWTEARALLARPRALASRPGNVEAWYELLLDQAKGAAADAQYQQAYDIARQVDDAYAQGTDVSQRPYGERDAYTDLVWFAAQTAMKTLARPAEAVALYDRYARAAQSPQTRAKGLYWAGRAAERAGNAAGATGYLEQATAYAGQFYGQLASERLGRALAAPVGQVQRPVDAATRDAFYAREVVQAARYLGTSGAYQDQTAFIRQIAQDAKSENDHVLAAELSRTLGRPDLGVMVGRSAVTNGLADYAIAGYPSVKVPAAANDSWTLVHAIARQESQFDRAAVSRVGARGLMQLMPATAREQAAKLGLPYDTTALTTDTDYNIQLGSAYFQRLYNSYGSYPLAIAAYNAGAGNVNRWLAAYGDPRMGSIDPIDWVESIPFSETRSYVQRVLENAVVYDLLNPERARSQGQARLSWYLGRRPS
ncbi:MAG: transglycosylase SLT domain-containing protein [Sphingomonas sp.]|uniref:lytic transglycosylase domain-containing protein n=1 Tax=Sphingomonas sp. TaxID=28214 RepID=UPI0025EF8AFA|nr:lytic transglycosylase domain-containing protein [Sphingomonas sp.]MBX9882809.1 transglycosylase SLT domain-containing protein [Sphingomonas sp.]